eukprot:scaffold259_cov252-Pinguiococcus_pyrenoidosus.AAC.42
MWSYACGRLVFVTSLWLPEAMNEASPGAPAMPPTTPTPPRGERASQSASRCAAIRGERLDVLPPDPLGLQACETPRRESAVPDSLRA